MHTASNVPETNASIRYFSVAKEMYPLVNQDGFPRLAHLYKGSLNRPKQVGGAHKCTTVYYSR